MAKNWAELPRELLGRILNRLCIDNIESFKMVCHPWFSVVQEETDLSLLCPAPSPPWLTVPPLASSGSESESEAAAFDFDFDDDDNKKEKKKVKKEEMLLAARFFNPTNTKVYSFQNEEMERWLPDREEAVCVGSSHGWLAFIDTRCVIYLTNPFKKPDDIINDEYRMRRIQLPSIETLPGILGVVKTKQRSSPSSGSGSLGVIDFKCWNYHTKKPQIMPSNDIYEFFIHKLVVDDHDDYTVMAIYGDRHELAFCKSGDKSWTPLISVATQPQPQPLLDRPLKNVGSYIDIHYSTNDQCFYAYIHTGSFEIWDLRNPSSPNCTYVHLPMISRVPPSLSAYEKWLRSQCTQRMYLVNFDGDVLLVVKYVAEQVTEDGQLYTKPDCADDECKPYKTLRFSVYKLDWVLKQWVLVRYLGNGDGVLFLGINNAMTFSACDFPALRGNSIYFTDDIFDLMPEDGRPYGGHDVGIFSLEDNSIHPCFYPGDLKKISPPPFWIAPSPW